MKVKVQTQWNGRDFSFRLVFKEGDSFQYVHVFHDKWDKKAAQHALDLLETCYGLKRKNIRFCHI